jgi:hypothetical protein
VRVTRFFPWPLAWYAIERACEPFWFSPEPFELTEYERERLRLAGEVILNGYAIRKVPKP